MVKRVSTEVIEIKPQKVARLERLELPALRFEASYFIQVSCGRAAYNAGF
jgi:hypothetical protein